MNTPSTNKCCEKCEPRLFTREWCRDEECDCHPKDDYKPTEPSVCDVRVQTAEGVNIPCRLPRPCKDHEPSEVTPKHSKPDCALRMKLGKHVLTSHTGAPLDCSCSCHFTPQQEEASSNKTIEELMEERKNHIVFHVPPGASEFDAWLRTALTKAYEAGQMEEGQRILKEASGNITSYSWNVLKRIVYSPQSQD